MIARTPDRCHCTHADESQHPATTTTWATAAEGHAEAAAGQPARGPSSVNDHVDSQADREHTPESSGIASGMAHMDLPRIAAAVREILLAVGEDPQREGLRDTPQRVARAYAELFSGLHRNAAVHLSRVFQQHSDEAVLVRDLAFHSLCEHHLLPVFGRVHVAYLPTDGHVVGLSKLARAIEVYAKRPQMQERFTEQIADALHEQLGARGVAVIVEGQHFCMKMRGVQQRDAQMTTSAFRGELASDSNLKAVTLGLLRPSERHDGDGWFDF